MSFKFIYNSVWALSQKGKRRLKKEEKSNKINWTLLNHTVLWFCAFILLYMRHSAYISNSPLLLIDSFSNNTLWKHLTTNPAVAQVLECVVEFVLLSMCQSKKVLRLQTKAYNLILKRIL